MSGLKTCLKGGRAALIMGAGLAIAAIPLSGASAQGWRGARISPSMSCDQLRSEIQATEQAIATAAEAIEKAKASGRAVEVGASAGINAALYSGALGRLGALGSLANQASHGMKQRAAATAERETRKMQEGEMRLAALEGAYAGKACGAEPEPAAKPAAPEPHLAEPQVSGPGAEVAAEREDAA